MKLFRRIARIIAYTCVGYMGLSSLSSSLANEWKLLPPSEETYSWIAETKPSFMGDGTDVRVSVFSKETYRDKHGLLLLACYERRTFLVVYHYHYRFWGPPSFSFGEEETDIVEYRVDENPVRTRLFRVAGEWLEVRSLTPRTGPESLVLIRELFDADLLRFRSKKSESGLTFDIRGLRKAIEPLRESCGW